MDKTPIYLSDETWESISYYLGMTGRHALAEKVDIGYKTYKPTLGHLLDAIDQCCGIRQVSRPVMALSSTIGEYEIIISIIARNGLNYAITAEPALFVTKPGYPAQWKKIGIDELDKDDTQEIGIIHDEALQGETKPSEHELVWITCVSMAFVSGCTCSKYMGKRHFYEKDAIKEWEMHSNTKYYTKEQLAIMAAEKLLNREG